MKEAAELSKPTPDYQVMSYYNCRGNPISLGVTHPAKITFFCNFSHQAAPLEENLFEWHFTVRGPGDTDFQVCSSFIIDFLVQTYIRGEWNLDVGSNTTEEFEISRGEAE